MKIVSLVFSYLLVLGAVVMSAWGILGFFEYFTGTTLLIPLQNPEFPSGTQFLHWLLITAAGVTFLAGYFLRWKLLPFAMLVIYAMLATLCAVQTFDFITEGWGVGDFAREVAWYIIITTYLFKSQRMRERLNR